MKSFYGIVTLALCFAFAATACNSYSKRVSDDNDKTQPHTKPTAGPATGETGEKPNAEELGKLQKSLEPEIDRYQIELLRAAGMKVTDFNSYPLEDLNTEACMALKGKIEASYVLSPLDPRINGTILPKNELCANLGGTKRVRANTHYGAMTQFRVFATYLVQLTNLASSERTTTYLLLDANYRLVEIQQYIGLYDYRIHSLDNAGSLYALENRESKSIVRTTYIPAESYGMVPLIQRETSPAPRVKITVHKVDRHDFDGYEIIPSAGNTLYNYPGTWLSTPNNYRELTVIRDKQTETTLCAEGMIHEYLGQGKRSDQAIFGKDGHCK